VQRLELSEVAAGISKLSHAESDEQLNQVGAGSLAAICVSQFVSAICVSHL